MESGVTLIGFGEAGSTFAGAGGWGSHACAFDILPARVAVMADHGVRPVESLARAISGASAIISVVTADAALAVAQDAANALTSAALFFDMNSVAPGTKRKAAEAIEAAGGRYVDVAVMAPVEPGRMAAPLLVSGPHAAKGAAALEGLGFSNVRVIAGEVGRASSIKMIRSVMVKGQEALTAEMMLAADKAGVTEEVLASLGDGWTDRASYNLERMTTHGVRRAAEMEEVAKTLDALGVDPLMTRGTIVRQRKMAA